MQDFTSIDFQSNKAHSAKSNYKKESLWLNFFASLSFSPDGQQYFLKVENLLTVIINFLDSYNNQQVLTNNKQQPFEIPYLALLILRNVSFNPANKSKLISQGKNKMHKIKLFSLINSTGLIIENIVNYLNTIIQQLRSKNELFQLLAVSTFDSLLYDYQKVVD